MGPAEVILLVDDDANDILTAQTSFAKANSSNPLHVVSSGQEAIDYLAGAGQFADRERFPLPTVVLLDLKMPDKDGFEVLEWARAQAMFGGILFIILTGLEKISDVNRAYQAGASSYLIKPFTIDRFNELVETVQRLRRKRKAA